MGWGAMGASGVPAVVLHRNIREVPVGSSPLRKKKSRDDVWSQLYFPTCRKCRPVGAESANRPVLDAGTAGGWGRMRRCGMARRYPVACKTSHPARFGRISRASPLTRFRATGISAPRVQAGRQCPKLARCQLQEPLVDALLRDYAPILIFLAIAVGLGLVLMLSALIIAVRNPDPEKVSAYECGFNAFDDARMKFDVRFYLVSILFIIFDLEIAFLFPWAVAFGEMSMAAFWSMMVFLAVLTVGFAYEWKKGALEWE